MTINGVPRAGTAPAGVDAIAGVQSAPVRTLVAAMLRPSDDWIAEILTKLLAPAPGSTAAGAEVVEGVGARARRRSSTARASTRATAARPPRSSPSCAGCPATPPSAAALARPGRPGTLQDRLTSGRARRACRGKTGTLPSGGVSALAGYCTTRKGRRLAFAVLARDVPRQEGAAGAGPRRPRARRHALSGISPREIPPGCFPWETVAVSSAARQETVLLSFTAGRAQGDSRTAERRCAAGTRPPLRR